MTDATGAPDEAGTPKSPDMGLPARLDMRRAFDIYVSGRDRTLAPSQKRDVVGGAVSEPFAEPPAVPPAHSETDGGVVDVPSELRFDRNAGTWRDRGGPTEEGAR